MFNISKNKLFVQTFKQFEIEVPSWHSVYLYFL